jgi:hypothetical protein
MAQVELVHPQGTHQVSIVHLNTKCDLFKNDPTLAMTPYQVQSEVSLDDFQDFISILKDKPININDKNSTGLLQLFQEFGFHARSGKGSDRQQSPGLVGSQATECRLRISALEERSGRHEDQLAVLQSMLFVAFKRLDDLASELKAVCDAKNSDSSCPVAAAVLPSAPAKSPPAAVPLSAPANPPPAAFSLSAPANSPPAAVPLSARAKSLPPAAVPSIRTRLPRLDSLIVREYPPLFEEFRMQQWLLLWRGSRDGYTAHEFHSRCDGHANTLTLILDTQGNVFGGFTPVKWESRTSNYWKGDDSLRSFLFTLRNPHGIPPRKLALKNEYQERALRCDSRDCARFGWDILVCDNCNTNRESFTAIGTNWNDSDYANDVDVRDLFTGAFKFTVKEIEVFEITN